MKKKVDDALAEARGRLPAAVSARKQPDPEPTPPEPPDFVIVGDYAERPNGADTHVLHQALAGVDAPEEPPPPHVVAFLDDAERSAGGVEFRFAPTLPGVLDACVAAELVARRPAHDDAVKALARRGTLTDRGESVVDGAPWVPHDRAWGGTENAALWRFDPARWAVFRA